MTDGKPYAAGTILEIRNRRKTYRARVVRQEADDAYVVELWQYGGWDTDMRLVVKQSQIIRVEQEQPQ